MNGKLIAMLIRSNALMIEALKMADANAQARDGGSYHFETAEFNNLVADCELLAKEAEAYTGDVEVRQVVSVAATKGVQRVMEQSNKPVSPMVPISPAHEVKHQSGFCMTRISVVCIWVNPAAPGNITLPELRAFAPPNPLLRET